MQLYKSVKQTFRPDAAFLEKMRTFQLMVNDCIRMGVHCEKPSYQAIKSICRARMLDYPIEDSYRFSAIFEAANLLKMYKKKSKTGNPSRPCNRNLFISASIGVSVSGDELTLPGGDTLKLNAHTTAMLSKQGVEVASVTLTPSVLGIVYRKPVEDTIPEGMVALDVNLENVTTCDTEGRTEVYDLTEITRIHEQCRRITSRFRRHDFRVRRRLFRKYSRIERDRKAWLLHNVSSTIAYRASAMKQTVVMENLKGIRGAFRKENKSAASYLSKMNSWPFAELQRQVEYKARCEGLQVIRVDPESTSNDCSACGGGMREPPEEHPMVTCSSCGLVIDRDLNAARNILSRALRSKAVGSSNEAMVGRAARGETASKVDGDHSSNRNNDWMKGSEYC